MYLVKTPWLLSKIYSSLTWKIAVEDQSIFLTFDDGPHPVVTTFVLDTLQQYNAKATFFCLGKNVEQFPDVYARILNDGHRVGNHSQDHLNGWKTDDATYLNNVMTARKFIDSNLYRPPYGRISNFQVQQLKKKFRIIMWDVLSADFDLKITPEKCLKYVVSNTKAGSIIVFHDSEKAYSRLKYALPKALEFFIEKGFSFRVIE
ncbi:MAG: polysaccharide deacetylase [Segetibacter sp.]|nr:polysaccharide deacetylase [Segetibacter sp.]